MRSHALLINLRLPVLKNRYQPSSSPIKQCWLQRVTSQKLAMVGGFGQHCFEREEGRCKQNKTAASVLIPLAGIVTGVNCLLKQSLHKGYFVSDKTGLLSLAQFILAFIVDSQGNSRK